MKPKNNSFGAQSSGYKVDTTLETTVTNKTATHRVQTQVITHQDSTDQTTAKTTRIDMIDPQTLLDLRARSARLTRLKTQAATHTHSTTDHTTHSTTNRTINSHVEMAEDMLINISITEINPETG